MHQRPTELSSGPVEIGEFGPICRKIEHGPVTIEILHEGDENGAGSGSPLLLPGAEVPPQRWSRPVVGAHHGCRSLRVRQVLRDRQAVVVACGGRAPTRAAPRWDRPASTSWSATTSSTRSCVSSSNGVSISSSRRTTTNWFERASSRHWRRRRRVAARRSASPGGHHGRVLLAQISDTHLLSDPGASAWGQNPAENLASVMRALPPVDALVATGDIVDDGTIEAYRLADALTRRGAARRYCHPGQPRRPCDHGGGVRRDRGLATRRAVGALDVGVAEHPMDRARSGMRRRPHTRAAAERARSRRDACRARSASSAAVAVPAARLRVDRRRSSASGASRRPGARRAVGPCPPALRGERRRHHVLGAPATFSQLRHGGDPHYTDTGEPPGAQILDLHDDGDFDRHIVLAEA